MMNKNYFSHFGLERGFNIDEGQLKKKFLELSRTYHPDFHTHLSQEEQTDVLELSSYTNLAFKTLKNKDARMKYLLSLHDVDFAEGNQSLPQEFLMEMMDFNEKLMEAQMDMDAQVVSELKEELKAIENGLETEVQTVIDEYEASKITEAELNKLKDYYFKKKYLLRIHENLDKFADAN